MNSLGFPKIFKGNSTIVEEGIKASKVCVYLLLNTEKGELFGDPDFGIRIKRYTFEQNNYILRDVLRDEIFEQLLIFCPQLYLEKTDINIKQSGNKLTAEITALNRVDYTTSTYNLVLLQDDSEIV